jgi:hypothetical protein
MPLAFWPATAEQVVAVVDAVVARRGSAAVELVAEFADLPKTSAEKALMLAVDLGLLRHNGSLYEVASPMCRFLSTSSLLQKAAALRVVLENYEPFTTFRERMSVVPVADAAEQTRVLLDLDQHREDVKDTLLSLGTFTQALADQGGGRYVAASPEPNPLERLAEACSDLLSAEARIREQLGPQVLAAISRDEVVVPLADALVKSRTDPKGAVNAAGSSVESFLEQQAPGAGVNVAGATGINARIERYLDAKVLPKKLGFVGKYLGHVRNAAGHGEDQEVGATWEISRETGVEYVFVACSFLRAVVSFLKGERPPRI